MSMYGAKQSGASAYSKVGLETGVIAASPHKLIVMLFDGAIVAIRKAAEQMAAGDIAAKGKSISHALMIIDSGLRASLNKEGGGEIAANLDALYEYMARQLLTANLQNKRELLDEVQRLLLDLRTSWEAIGTAAPAAPAAPARPQPAYDALAPRSNKLYTA
jgi:flagellar protein FliS